MSDPVNPLNRNYQLVTAVTPDAVKLHGLFQESAADQQTSLDAAIVLHGLGGNFYGSSLNLRLADALRDMGMAVAIVNTRGHDGISMNPVSGRAATIGAAYEIVDDCRQDVAGWIGWLGERGYSQIALVGHSLGAIKALYAQAHLRHEMICTLVGLSATRLCHEKFLESERAEDFKKWLGLATEMTEQGRGDELIRVDFPFPTYMTASAYGDKYGPADRYDWTRYVDQIDVPTMLMFGERELRDNAAFHGMLETAQTIARRRPHFSVQVIESANHFYAGVHWRATDAIRQWMQERL